MTNNRILILALACALFFPSAAASASTSRLRRYSTVYAHQYKPAQKYARGTLQGDFVWAAESSSIRTAGVRWKDFLRVHEAKELDSAIEARLLTIAKYELMRIYYLLGNHKEGDKLLKELDPLKLQTAPEAQMFCRSSGA